MLKQKITFSLLICFILFSNLLAQDISSGKKLIRNEQYSQAKKYFVSMLNSPMKSESYFNLGQIYFMMGEIDSARISYSNGIRSDEEFALNYAGMFKINVAENNTVEAEKNKTAAIDISDNKDAEVYSVLAESFSSRNGSKNYDKAIELLNAGMKMKNNLVVVHLAAAKLYLENGNGTEAIKSAEDVLDIDPENPEALTVKAKVYILIQNNNDAISLLTQAIQSDSTYSPAYRELAELYANIKDYSKAAEYYAKYVKASSVTIEKRKRYASILYMNKEYSMTINILEDLIKDENDPSSSIRILAYSYYKLEDIENSINYFQKLFNLAGINYLSTDFENYADLLTKTGNDSLAIENLAKVFEMDSSREDILSKMSVLYFKNKKWDGVISSLNLKKTLTAQEYFDLGKAYYFNGDKIIANEIKSLTSRITLSDEQYVDVRAALLNYQSELRFAIGIEQRTTEAINKLSQSIESIMSPGQKTDWLTIQGQWLDEVRIQIKDDYTKADSAFFTLSVKVPDLSVAYFWRARVNTNFDPESELGYAKPFYEQFINLAASDSAKYKKELIESYSYLGYYYYLKDDLASSKSYWQEVYKLDPENKQAAEVIKQIK